MNALQPTVEPDVWVEEKRPGYVRYVRDDGTRWEVEGVCDMRGDCLVGAVIDGKVLTRDDVDALTERPDSPLDVPVLPGFKGCCPLIGRWLP